MQHIAGGATSARLACTPQLRAHYFMAEGLVLWHFHLCTNTNESEMHGVVLCTQSKKNTLDRLSRVFVCLFSPLLTNPDVVCCHCSLVDPADVGLGTAGVSAAIMLAACQDAAAQFLSWPNGGIGVAGAIAVRGGPYPPVPFTLQLCFPNGTAQHASQLLS